MVEDPIAEFRVKDRAPAPRDEVGSTLAQLRHMARRIRKLATDPATPDELKSLAVDLSRAVEDLDVIGRRIDRRIELSNIHARLILERARAGAEAIKQDAELDAARIRLRAGRAVLPTWGKRRPLVSEIGFDATGAEVDVERVERPSPEPNHIAVFPLVQDS